MLYLSVTPSNTLLNLGVLVNVRLGSISEYLLSIASLTLFTASNPTVPFGNSCPIGFKALFAATLLKSPNDCVLAPLIQLPTIGIVLSACCSNVSVAPPNA